MKQQEYVLLSIEEHQALVKTICDWRLYCKATASINETISEIHKQSVIDANTPYRTDLLDKAKKRNLAHIREVAVMASLAITKKALRIPDWAAPDFKKTPTVKKVSIITSNN